MTDEKFVSGLQAIWQERRAAKELECQGAVERERAVLEHRREMELKHGWPPAGGGVSSVSVVGCGQSRGNGGGIAMAALFLSVAMVAVGLIMAVALGEPREWVVAYLELRSYLQTEDAAIAACFEQGGVADEMFRCAVYDGG